MSESEEASGTPPSAAEIISGLLYTHHRANANSSEVHHTRATVEALVALLVEQGVINPERLAATRQRAADALRTSYVDRGMVIAIQDYEESKYAFGEGPEIDCASRVSLCKAACCRLRFALSKEDVGEGVVRWDLGQPYMNARGSDGYCVHLDRGTCGCSVHAHRPVTCRSYDCRGDTRIWLDFDARVINPLLNEPDWPRNTDVGTASMNPDEPVSGGR